MPIATVRQLCTPSAIVKSDSLVEQVAQIEDFASGKIDGPEFFQRNYFTEGLNLLVRRGFERLAGKSEDGAFYLTQAMGGGNRHLGTNASSIAELVYQLGIARFGHRPIVGDTFCGGGSIPFEAARVGCDVYASDLNPIACMLTWGAFNIIGADKHTRSEIDDEQNTAIAAVDAEITRLGIEQDTKGNRAKAYLYCLETRCPKTGWMVPMLGSLIISKTRGVVARLVPDHLQQRYDIEIRSGVSAAEMAEAVQGTVRDGRLVHPMNPERSDHIAIRLRHHGDLCRAALKCSHKNVTLDAQQGERAPALKGRERCRRPQLNQPARNDER
jgi:hypothetical protein